MDDETTRQLVAILTIGADRPTAAAYIGLTNDELASEISRHENLEREVARAEATAELTHLRNIKTAAADPKNWRASMWWLRSRQPDRYGRRAGTVTETDLNRFAEEFFAALDEQFSPADIETVRQRIDQLLAHTAAP